ncbi:hypothetical protein SAMN05216388_101162 [Halorientalis persicus]|jgi:hypothetical protein|uniref:Uncharacterized protein n=2 Tax=Halorientalis persicus TaxID=1367881 RepID=A0A1H8NV90_9EURY|nr:hypothetical protein SAMN05216388_101162 [Halorientalis persicus]
MYYNDNGMERRTLLSTLGAGVVAVSGCLGEQSSGAGTPLPAGSIDFPDGPKERPERPSPVSETAAREYVKRHEYRYVYNSLWMGKHTDVVVDCRVDSVEQRQWGYEAVVTCTGYAESRANGTVTPAHADWFTQSYRYRVSENTTQRLDAENRDPVP